MNEYTIIVILGTSTLYRKIRAQSYGVEHNCFRFYIQKSDKTWELKCSYPVNRTIIESIEYDIKDE